MTVRAGQITTCLVSENSALMGRRYHALERSAIPIDYGYYPWGQANGRRAHPNNDEHIEAIEKGREYLVDAWFSQCDSNDR